MLSYLLGSSFLLCGGGSDGKLIPLDFKSGDKVLLPSYGGQSIKVGDEVSSLLSFCFLSFIFIL